MKIRSGFFIIFGLFLFIAAASAQPTIDASNWPYGSDQIGNYWYYHYNSANVAVSIAAIDPYQQGGTWDFTTGPTDLTATSTIHVVGDAPAPPPANTSYVEYQTQGGEAQWMYEDELGDGTWARGFWQGGTIYEYDAPQWNIYHYPMTYATQWSSSWTWEYLAGEVWIEEVRDNEIVGWGTVTVPFGGPVPCLVIRTYQTTYSEYMGVPLVDDKYRIYEWIVPGIGSVTTIQSVNLETSWYFNTAKAFFRLYNSNLGGDLIKPDISDVTDFDDTPNPGPYSISAVITDDSGIDSAAILYSIDGAPYETDGPTSVVGDTFLFEIPEMTGSPVQEVRYYIWARDGSANQNQATDPADAPTSYYSFDWINDNLPPDFSDVTIWPSPTEFNGPYPVEATITDDNGILFASIHYKFGGGAWEESPADSNNGDAYYFTIPEITATTIIRYYLEAVDNSGFFNTGYYPAAGASGPVVFQAIYLPPSEPKAIEDLVILPDGNDIILNWTEVTADTNGNPITVSSYTIYRGVVGDGSDADSIDTSPTNTYTDVGAVPAAVKYFYDVRAVGP
ncbi:hypothetical protein KKB28_02595 [bacterium]|nr:hypothetical protein [bacterium]